jgi:DNA modification methylase
LNFTVHHGDCLDVLRGMADNSVDSIVTDPPYGLSFMGKKWDYDVPSVAIWVECLRVLKPGGHLLAFAGTRTQHRMAARIEDAGFEIRDLIAWVYGSGFPKSLDVSKAIDKSDAGDEQRARRLRFTAWVRSTGLSAARIDELTGTQMGGHYATAASQPAVATRDHFEILRPHFGCEVPDWVEVLVDERTVESENFKRRAVVSTKEMTDTSVARPACAYSAQGLDAGAPRREVAITAAHTAAAQAWEGWGTALKPALEPITVARKPLIGTVAANVLEHGTGAVNVDGCRVGDEVRTASPSDFSPMHGNRFGDPTVVEHRERLAEKTYVGRWPANLIHDGSDEVLSAFPQAPGQMAKASTSDTQRAGQNTYGAMARGSNGATPRGDAGSAARFFYCAKASRKDRGEGNKHPTVKPTDLMRYLCRLVTPPGGLVLDPFTGSGSTGKAAVLEGFRFVGVERDADSVATAEQRIAEAAATGPAGADDVLQEPGQEVAAVESSIQALEAAEPVPAAASSEPVLREGPRRAKAPKAVAPINQLDMFEASA